MQLRSGVVITPRPAEKTASKIPKPKATRKLASKTTSETASNPTSALETASITPAPLTLKHRNGKRVTIKTPEKLVISSPIALLKSDDDEHATSSQNSTSEIPSSETPEVSAAEKPTSTSIQRVPSRIRIPSVFQTEMDCKNITVALPAKPRSSPTSITQVQVNSDPIEHPLVKSLLEEKELLRKRLEETERLLEQTQAEKAQMKIDLDESRAHDISDKSSPDSQAETTQMFTAIYDMHKESTHRSITLALRQGIISPEEAYRQLAEAGALMNLTIDDLKALVKKKKTSLKKVFGKLFSSKDKKLQKASPLPSPSSSRGGTLRAQKQLPETALLNFDETAQSL